jgi:copper transporter 1
MDHGHDMMPKCSMNMLFTWDTTDLCIVFPWWHIRGTYDLVVSLIIVVLFGMTYELLREIARQYGSTGVLSIGRDGMFKGLIKQSSNH